MVTRSPLFMQRTRTGRCARASVAREKADLHRRGCRRGLDPPARLYKKFTWIRRKAPETRRQAMRMNRNTDSPLLGAPAAARRLGISRETLRQLDKRGA